MCVCVCVCVLECCLYWHLRAVAECASAIYNVLLFVFVVSSFFRPLGVYLSTIISTIGGIARQAVTSAANAQHTHTHTHTQASHSRICNISKCLCVRVNVADVDVDDGHQRTNKRTRKARCSCVVVVVVCFSLFCCCYSRLLLLLRCRRQFFTSRLFVVALHSLLLRRRRAARCCLYVSSCQMKKICACMHACVLCVRCVRVYIYAKYLHATAHFSVCYFIYFIVHIQISRSYLCLSFSLFALLLFLLL